MMNSWDVAVVGAGPAGIRAALSAAEVGAKVVLIDEQAVAGGQIYREVARHGDARGDVLGADYREGAALVDQLGASAVVHRTGCVLWNMDQDGVLTFSVQGVAEQLKAKRVVLATGALERAFPFPGWTLPGVISAGAAQVLLKGSGVVPQHAVLVGSGPLLYLLAMQLVAAGVPPLALVETQSRSSLYQSVRYLPQALKGWRYLLKGTQLLWGLKRAGIKRYRGVSAVCAEGEGAVNALSFDHRGQRHSIECQQVLIHQGVVPNVQLTRALALEHHWDEQQRCFTPQTDDWGRSSEESIFVAGDGAGIGGATAAALQGQLSGLRAACDLGLIEEAELADRTKPLRVAIASELAVRPLLDTLYRSPNWVVVPEQDDTILCRCEGVTVGEVQDVARGNCIGPNQAKAFCRAGMGPCQGRYCGLGVSEVFAAERQQPHEQVGYFRLRFPSKNVTLGEMASLANPSNAEADE